MRLSGYSGWRFSQNSYAFAETPRCTRTLDTLRPTPLPAACGADTGSPVRSRRTAAGGSSSIPGISLSRNQRCASGYEMDVLPSLALAPSLDSSPFVTRPQSSCTALGGWSYLAPGEPPAGSHLPVPDTPHRPTPCAPRRAVGPATCACRPPKPPTYTPNAHGLAWSPPRCAPSARSTTASLCASDASPDRAFRCGSSSTMAHE